MLNNITFFQICEKCGFPHWGSSKEAARESVRRCIPPFPDLTTEDVKRIRGEKGNDKC